MMETEYTCNRKCDWDYGSVEVHQCKYQRRVEFLPCKWKLKVTYKSNSDEVTVEKNVDEEEHCHEINPEYEHTGVGFRWTKSQTEIVFEGVRNGAKPKIILRNLRKAKAFNTGNEPTMPQIYNKVSHTKTLLQKADEILNTHDLRMKAQDLFNVPESDLECYIPFYEINDEDDKYRNSD